MVPNLTVALMTAFNPSRWRSSHRKTTSVQQPPTETEHWNKPTPGLYEYFPGAGWYLVQRDGETDRLAKADRVIWSDALDRKLLLSDYISRSKKGKLPMPRPAGSRNSSTTKLPPGAKEKFAQVEKQQQQLVPASEVSERPEVHFVCMDDGITWLNDKDSVGAPTKGPWQRFCIDKETGEFRGMTLGDDPKRSRPSSLRSKSVSTTARDSDENVSEDKKSSSVSRSSSAAKRVGASSVGKLGDAPERLKEERVLEEP